MFDISENTVKSRMRYALQSLRAALEDFEGFSFDATDTEEVGGR
jgi:DNA-directed RNA polymerase specialized sigma24 family protein